MFACEVGSGDVDSRSARGSGDVDSRSARGSGDVSSEALMNRPAESRAQTWPGPWSSSLTAIARFSGEASVPSYPDSRNARESGDVDSRNARESGDVDSRNARGSVVEPTAKPSAPWP